MMPMKPEELRQLRAWSFDKAMDIHLVNQVPDSSGRKKPVDLAQVLRDAKKITNYVRSSTAT